MVLKFSEKILIPLITNIKTFSVTCVMAASQSPKLLVKVQVLGGTPNYVGVAEWLGDGLQLRSTQVQVLSPTPSMTFWVNV